jgi:hypothetical protein
VAPPGIFNILRVDWAIGKPALKDKTPFIMFSRTQNIVSHHRLIYLLILLLFAVTLSFADILHEYEIISNCLIVFFIMLGIIYLSIFIVDVIRRQVSISQTLIVLSLILVLFFEWGWYSGIFNGTPIGKMYSIGERGRKDIKLYSSGKFLLFDGWIFGEERFEGSFEINGNSIMFNQFLSGGGLVDHQKMFIDKTQMILYYSLNDSIPVPSGFHTFKIEYLRE